jgi:hypothetical protein
MAHVIYELSFKGRASDVVRALFDDFEVATAHGITTVRGQFADQAALHGALARIQGLGLELLEVRLVAEADEHDVPTWDCGEHDEPRSGDGGG